MTFSGSRLELHSASRLLFLEHDAPAVWRRLEADQPPPSPSPVPTAVVVWRSGFEVFHAVVGADEAEALGEDKARPRRPGAR